jgi:hypothetical protein
VIAKDDASWVRLLLIGENTGQKDGGDSGDGDNALCPFMLLDVVLDDGAAWREVRSWVTVGSSELGTTLALLDE